LEKLILEEKSEDIVLLTLNRPEKRNALSPELVSELSGIIERLKSDTAVKAVIITGNGSAFCAGADLAYLKELSAYTDEENLQDSQALANLFQEIYMLPKLTIALLNGPALAGGFGLALCCDYLIAADEGVKVGFTEVRIGFVPAIVMNFLIRRIQLYTAYHLVISGSVISAEEALKIGIIQETIPPAELRARTVNFISKLLEQNSLSAMIQTKQLFQDLLEKPIDEGLELACRINAKSRKSADCQLGLKQFLEKKPIQWRDLSSS
jgi:methylglutaconyl-CoA hydratase